MKAHTTGFKENLIELGRELRGVITYGNTTLEEEIYSITPHYNADLLKSVMKQLDLELSVDIPLNTIINCQIGIKVNNNYEMLNYGNYVVYNSEKQEDTGTYKITCYDKLLYSMKQNEDLGITYPISIKNYLRAVANKIGLTVANQTFYNEDMQIPSELYLGLEYTYRDILDEIAQATGSIIALNENDEIQVKYPTQTNDTIDEEYLKDVNVKFGERYGAINTIVLSRAGESDNVYYPDPLPANPIEIKIVDNQIMNFNNRSDYLEGIYNALNGLYYYINDFSSTGILYYEVGDLYNVKVGENTYQCLMLNDEVNVTTGIEELVHTDLPEKTETDYSKADKTDRRINQTYLVVDKQNQKIESLVSNVTEQNNKISQVTQTIDELNSKIQDIADITTYGESDKAFVELEGINQSEPIMIRIHPTSTNISYLYPHENLYPSDLQFLPDRKIRFKRTYEDGGETLTENIDYTLPDDLLRYSSEVYDEFYLDYDSHTCQVIKRCKYNADGSVSQLANEVTIDYTYPQILLGDGDYEISLPGYDFGYIYVRLMAQNIYTTQFATKAELTSEINQSAQQIDLSVNQKLSNYSTTTEMNSAITVKANEINSTVSQKVGKNEVISSINQSAEAVTINAGKINLNGAVTANQNFKIKTDGSMEAKNGTFTGGNISLTGGTIDNPRLQVVSSSSSSTKASIAPDAIRVGSGSVYLSFSSGILNIRNNNSSFQMLANSSRINASVDDFYVIGTMHANAYNYDSLQSIKKNIKKYDKNVLDIIKNGEIYEFNFKTEDNKIKKHIGFVIPDEGGNFYTPPEVLAQDGMGIDSYNMTSILWKAVQEQQEQIEQMKKEIKKLKGDDK